MCKALYLLDHWLEEAEALLRQADESDPIGDRQKTEHKTRHVACIAIQSC